MLALGQILKEQREKKLLTIREVAQITKIKEKYIEALEKELLDCLPQRVYTIGFIQNLSSLYQLSSDELILAYDALTSNFNLKNNKKNENYSIENIERLSVDNKNIDSYNKNTEKEKFINNEEKVEAVKNKFIKDEELLKLKNTVEKKAEEIAEKDFPTSKIVMEFESLLKEEERFQTQKIKKKLLEKNINKIRSIKKKFFNNEDVSNKGPMIMILILLIIAFFLLLYIIITVLLK